MGDRGSTVAPPDVLTPTQRTLARIILSALPDGFALAGGGAMNESGVVDRPTQDLDVFGPFGSQQAAATMATDALAKAGYASHRLVDAEGFVRLSISVDDGIVLVDIGNDLRLFDPVATELGPVISIPELAADKTLALFGRAAARDLIDVRALVQRLGLDVVLDLAAAKDRGFALPWFIAGVRQAASHDADEFELPERELADLRAWALALADDLEARPPQER